MNILAIDTATPYVTVGVVRLHDTASAAQSPRAKGSAADSLDGPQRPCATQAPMLTDIAAASGSAQLGTRGHSESLMPSIMEVLAAQGLAPSDIDRVVVGTGPGPFTGLRVGMATANAFAQAIDAPVLGVSTLDILAWSCVISDALAADGSPAGPTDPAGSTHNAPAGSSSHPGSPSASPAGSPEFLLVATDARRKEVYWALYELHRGESVTPITQPAVNRPSDVIAQVNTLTEGCIDVLMLTESIAAPFVKAFATGASTTGTTAAPHTLAAVLNAIPDIRAFILAARTSPGWDTATTWASSPTLQPLYLRRPDAVPPKQKPVSPAIGEDVVRAARNGSAPRNDSAAADGSTPQNGTAATDGSA